MEELKSNEETVVKLTTVITAAREPGADGGFTDAEYFFEGGSIDAQGEQMEFRTNCLGISLQAIQDRVFVAGELCFAGLAAQVLNGFMLAMVAISDESMDSLIGNGVIGARYVGAEVTLGGDGFLFSAFAFTLHPRNGQNM